MLESLKTHDVRGSPMQNSSLSGRKIFRAYGLTLCFSLALIVPGFGRSAEIPLEKTRLAYPSRSLSALNIRIAQEKGFYRKHGLQVEAVQVRPAVTAVALMSGGVEYSSAVGSALSAAAKGAPLKVVSVSLTAPFFSLVARPQYRRIQELKGKEIGVQGNPGGTNDQVARLVLRQGGLDPQNDLRILYVGDPPVLYAAFKGGRFDAIFTSLPFPVAAEQDGFRILVNAAETIRLAFTGLVVTEERLKTARDQIKRMIVADVEARRFIRKEKDQTVEVIVRWLGMSRSIAQRSYELALPAFSSEPTIDQEGLRRNLEMLIVGGISLKTSDPEHYIDATLVDQLRKEEERALK